MSSVVENVVHAQPASVQVKILKRMIGNQQPKELKRSQKMRLRV